MAPPTNEREPLPSVERLASLIGRTDVPDQKTVAIASATRSHLVTGAVRKAPKCWTCLHHTVFCRSVPVLQCMHPAIATTKRDVVNGYTVIESRHCDVEREDAETSSHGRVILCGVEGRLHEPLTIPWLFPVTRALFRKMKAEW